VTGLVEFLRARIDEDQRYATHAAGMMIGTEAGFHGMAHINRWRPARVLAECDAKRRIVAEHADIDPCDAHDAAFKSIPCDTLRLLALPYADHPGYRSEWAP
jgi:Family of unknown function (DUF6221)